YTGVKTLWTAHNIGVNNTGVAISPNRNASRWYEIGSMTTTPALVQTGTLFDNAGANPNGFWIPSIVANGEGHALLGFSYAGALTAPGAGYTSRLAADTPGTTSAAFGSAGPGGAYNLQGSGVQRWGDYSQTVVDPNDDMTI